MNGTFEWNGFVAAQNVYFGEGMHVCRTCWVLCGTQTCFARKDVNFYKSTRKIVCI